MSVWDTIARSKKPPFLASVAVAVILIAAMTIIRDVVARQFPLPIGYSVPVVLLAFLRSRRVLWATVSAFALLAIVKFWFLLPEAPRAVGMSAQDYNWIEGILVLFDLFLVAALVDIWIVTRNWLESQHVELESANSELAAREEEIARQNEELQSQTEELERQSEELRGTNEELAHREKTLEILLSLSRSLHTELLEGEIMERICETLGLLINGPTTGAAILEQRDSNVHVRCHHGFGKAGLREQEIPIERSLAGLVLTKGRTGYIEDLTLRPDLTIPQPREGEPMLAVLATPLRVRGEPVGSLEVYSRHKTTWNQEQIALVESLAAQASVSLEAAQLFQSVEKERNRFQAVLRTVPIGVVVANPEFTDVRVNPAGAAMFGVPADQNLVNGSATGRWRLFSGGKELGPQERPLLRAAREGIETHALEVELVTAGGRRLVLLTHARPIRDAGSTIQGAVGTFADITPLRELNRELDLRRREAEEASVRKTRFLAAVSHDIRTPANAISLLAELIRRTSVNPALAADVPDLAQELHSSAISLVNLLSDVLDIARFDSDKVDLQESEFSLSDLLNDEQRQLFPLARQKGLSLQINVPSDPLVLRTDRIKLARILGNLVGNAIKFTEQGGVTIDAHRNGDGSVQISVRDTGSGIAPEHLSHIFDEFFQLRNPERDRAKGSGLGLTICKRLVDAMGGAIHVQSAPGQGSAFTVTLPGSAVVPQPRPGMS
ncbi:MAG TPA: ATP-binding protein [Tepidisphaeraceae bacterium]|nr:ATP-binding protein [Tepidisphaeraceae bacterium]